MSHSLLFALFSLVMSASCAAAKPPQKKPASEAQQPSLPIIERAETPDPFIRFDGFGVMIRRPGPEWGAMPLIKPGSGEIISSGFVNLSSGARISVTPFRPPFQRHRPVSEQWLVLYDRGADVGLGETDSAAHCASFVYATNVADQKRFGKAAERSEVGPGRIAVLVDGNWPASSAKESEKIFNDLVNGIQPIR